PVAMTAALHSVGNVRLTTTHFGAGAFQNFTSAPSWVSYVYPPVPTGGTNGDDRLLGIALDPSGDVNNPSGTAQPVVVTGFSQDAMDPTEIDGMVARLSADGKSGTVFTLALGSGSRTEGHSIDVDANGTIYVSGQTDAGGFTSDLVLSIDPTLNTLNLAV